MARYFPFQSPYTAFDGNPIIYTDPNGGEAALCCNLLGGLVYGLTEFAEQVVDNVIAGEGFASLYKIDVADILIESADGLLNGAIPESIKEIAKSSVDWRPNEEGKNKFDFSFNSIKEGLVNTAVNKGVARSQKRAKVLGKKLDSSAKDASRKADYLGRKLKNKPHRKNEVRKAKAKSKKLNTIKKITTDQVRKISKKLHTDDKVLSVAKDVVSQGVQGSVINQTVKNPINENNRFTEFGNESVLKVEIGESGFVLGGSIMYQVSGTDSSNDGLLTDAKGFKVLTGRLPGDSDKARTN